MLQAYHLTARSYAPSTPLSASHSEACAYLWTKLQARFPEIAACIFMPNHVHILVFTSDPAVAKRALATELRAWTRKFYPGKKLWEPLPPPNAILDIFHLKRQIRYVHLNPCRRGLARDPLEWEWSTHRDVTGCIANPWPDLVSMAEYFGTTRTRLPEVIHRYISSDPSVAVAGTPAIAPPENTGKFTANYAHILRAASMALRRAPLPTQSTARDLAVHIASRFELIPDPGAFKMCRTSWKRALARPIPAQALQAALRILSDSRLLFTPKKSDGVNER